MTTDDELKAIYGMFTDTWRMYRQYADIRQQEDSRWESLADEAAALARKYGNGRFIRGLVMAVMDELERRSKEPKTEPKSGI